MRFEGGKCAREEGRVGKRVQEKLQSSRGIRVKNAEKEGVGHVKPGLKRGHAKGQTEKEIKRTFVF